MTGRNMHFAHTWANIKNIKPVIIQKHRKKYQVLEISSFVLKLCQLCLYYHLLVSFSPLLKTHNPLMLSLETRSNALCSFSRLEHQNCSMLSFISHPPNQQIVQERIIRCIPPNPRRVGYIDPIHGPLYMGSIYTNTLY